MNRRSRPTARAIRHSIAARFAALVGRHAPDRLRRGALIGAAIYASLGNQSFFAEPPSLAQRKEVTLDFGVNQNKGDRLVKSVDIVADKQTFKEPTAIKLGDKEVVKVHSFTRVETTLLLTAPDFPRTCRRLIR